MATVVVASDRLRFGQQLTEAALKEVPWPKDAVPEGAFASIADLVDENGGRKALKTIEAGEPILSVKISDKNGHAGLAGVIIDLARV